MERMRWMMAVALFCLPAMSVQAEEAAPVAKPRFTRHVMPVFSKLGCNAGLCHGAVQGKGGLKLSLFGAEPALDHERLVREFAGRRINLANPDASLLLLKPTNQAEHEGGKRLQHDSPEYKILRGWIGQGATLDDAVRLTQLTVTPARQVLRPEERFQLRVEAAFADGSKEDVTQLCVYESRDDAVALVERSGQVTATGIGDTAIVVRYQAQPVLATVFVTRPGKIAFPVTKGNNFIDTHVLDKLRRLGLPPAELCDDATFLRRVSLDVTGALPTPEQIRAFQANKNPDKRERKIEELLKQPGHAALWATRFSDVLRPRISYEDFTHRPEPASVRRFHDWLRARLEENLPYDELVARLLTATTLDGRSRAEWLADMEQLYTEDKASGKEGLKIYQSRKTLDLYWHRFDSTGVQGAIQTAHAFLGLRLQCAECHRHPHDIWTQDDLLSFANFFMRVRANTGVLTVQEAKKVRDAAGNGLTEEEKKQLTQKLGKNGSRFIKMLEVSAVYHTRGNPFGWASVTSPLGTQKSEQFRLLGDKQTLDVPDEQDPRELVAAWLRRPDNPFFARAVVNRVWAHYFGRGLVDPVDDMSPLNPPTHPELLKELSDGFIAHKFDLRWLHHTILTSRTYQQSVQRHPDCPPDSRNYASFYRRRLPAEVLIDAINHATDSSEKFGSPWIPAGARVVEVPGRDIDGLKTNNFVEHAFSVFGKPLRSPESVCDCERENLPTLEQCLFLANHPETLKKIAAPAGRVARIVKACTDDEQRVEQIYLWTVCRMPGAAERKLCLAYLQKSPSPQKGLEGLMWTLLNSSEFLLNR
ncbi:MAG: DUF1549 domain-containing protein [Gemmataceae bacterium]